MTIGARLSFIVHTCMHEYNRGNWQGVSLIRLGISIHLGAITLNKTILKKIRILLRIILSTTKNS